MTGTGSTPVAATSDLMRGRAAMALVWRSGRGLLGLRHDTAASCRSFGPSGTPLRGRHVVRNGVLIAAALTAGLAASFGAEPELHPAPLVIPLTATACAASVVIRFDELTDLLGSPPIGATVSKDER